MTRDVEHARQRAPELEWVQGDVGDAAASARALEDCRAVLYLVHGMGDGANYDRRELDAASTFSQTAAKAGVERIVYLGGVAPAGAGSKHLRSRLDVGET